MDPCARDFAAVTIGDADPIVDLVRRGADVGVMYDDASKSQGIGQGVQEAGAILPGELHHGPGSRRLIPELNIERSEPRGRDVPAAQCFRETTVHMSSRFLKAVLGKQADEPGQLILKLTLRLAVPTL